MYSIMSVNRKLMPSTDLLVKRWTLEEDKGVYIYDSFYKVEIHIREKVDNKIRDQVKKPIYSSLFDKK